MRRSMLRTTTPLLLCVLPTLLLYGVREARALTAEEILQLKQAGVSDDTIQDMLQNERMKQQQKAADAPSAAMEQDKFANDHIGSWTTSDGRVVLSTGKADPQKDVFDPTVPQNPADTTPMNVYPYVFTGAGPPGPPAPVIGPHGPIGGGGFAPR
ncbi:hypothetical protein K2Z84_06390 [Candidatus Binatia bacterium]|nr:hypothetical protein [Candidatus Binatia bacterium]